MTPLSRMKELVSLLNAASKAYYQEDRELMSNLEYDKLYDELTALEEETGTVFANSPTKKVGYEVLSELPKEPHPSPMLSLDKTKEVAALAAFIGGKEGILSWKMDGLTVVLTYRDGSLFKAVTRGNGEIGEVITNNAKTFVNIPSRIPYQGELIIRGEAVITYSDFEKINAGIADVDAKYKNPRNLCSGTVRQLNNEITAKRNVHFFVFQLVDVDGMEFENSVENRFLWLSKLGFDVVEYKKVTADTMEDTVKWFADKVSTNDFPSDGLVLMFDDITYGRSLGRTAKFPRDSIAFKWRDELAETTFSYIEWSPSRTGLINPVAVFEPVELEGTSVARASVHNVSILESLELIPGDRITVYKANMIIPQIAENLSAAKREQPVRVEIPDSCPACGGATAVEEENGTRTLICTNPLCSSKKRKLFAHFVSRNAMNIDGFSEASIDKFVEAGLLSELPDIFTLPEKADSITAMEGFGEKSFDKLVRAIEAARDTEVARLLYGLGIPGFGVANAKTVAKFFKQDIHAICQADYETLLEIEGIGDVMARDFEAYFANAHNVRILDELLRYLHFKQYEEHPEANKLAGLTFVITGSLNTYENRDALKAYIEERGGKVAGSVSKNTSYLINNDVASASSKNKKAKELGVPIISEEEFNNRFQ